MAIDVTAANKLVADLTTIPEGMKRSEIEFKDVLCAEGDFVCGMLTNGKYAAMWQNHIQIEEDVAIFCKEILNAHENTLLKYGINK